MLSEHPPRSFLCSNVQRNSRPGFRGFRVEGLLLVVRPRGKAVWREGPGCGGPRAARGGGAVRGGGERVARAARQSSRNSRTVHTYISLEEDHCPGTQEREIYVFGLRRIQTLCDLGLWDVFGTREWAMFLRDCRKSMRINRLETAGQYIHVFPWTEDHCPMTREGKYRYLVSGGFRHVLHVPGIGPVQANAHPARIPATRPCQWDSEVVIR